MAHVHVTPEEAATGVTKEEYEAALGRAGRIWNIVSIQSQLPEVMRGSMPRPRALLGLAEKLTEECASIDSGDIAELRAHGFDDRGISSCVQVVAYFNYINRIAEGLGVPAEDWIGQDGKPRQV